MNILFLTRFSPKDINTWSGTLFHIYHKLKEKHTVEIIGPEILNQLTLFTRGNFSTNTFIPDDRYIKRLGRLLSERINTLGCDLIFLGDIYFIPLDVNIPFVLFSDMTFEQVKLHCAKSDERNIEPCLNLERCMLGSSFKIIYSSEWAKNKTIEFYATDPKKISVVEFGANIPTPKNYSIDINMDICRLVFIGKNWEKKGGDKVLQAYKILKEEGFPCSLTIIGSMPEDEREDDEDLTIIPFLDKSKKEDLKKLCDILSESHFLVLPTQFDAFGIVFCEASAYAVPSIAANVGGVGQAVKEGENGFLLPPDATASVYAEKIKILFSDKENYFKLRQSSRNEFDTRLNWDVWGEKVNKILETAVTEWQLQKKNN
ncbi:MAG: glycosyltransferase family 4 protein [Dysgonamonadaceae bacterium]|nr:glycosyltransferase family 4 protein [Dysgonamonadaceae bacterium]